MPLTSANALAEVWAYVDDLGRSHLAPTQLDERYQLFFKGNMVADGSQAARPSPQEPPAAAHSALYERLVNHPNAARFERLIEQHAMGQSLDPALVKAVIAAESAFQPGAVSPKGARGLMQVMPDTAARYGLVGDRQRSAEQKLLDPALNLRIGTHYLRDLLARFSNDVALTLAAYNAGEMAVARYNNRIPPYRETVEYVKRVQAFYAVLRPPLVATQEPASITPGRRIRGTFLAQPAPQPSDAPVAIL